MNKQTKKIFRWKTNTLLETNKETNISIFVKQIDKNKQTKTKDKNTNTETKTL